MHKLLRIARENITGESISSLILHQHGLDFKTYVRLVHYILVRSML